MVYYKQHPIIIVTIQCIVLAILSRESYVFMYGYGY